MEKATRGWEWWHVALVGLGTAGTAIASMWLWTVLVVEPWAARARAYTDPAAFGDSLAPVGGALTALALGAAVTSVFMQRSELQLQREEMRAQRAEMADAREQYTAQSEALDLANELARRANELAVSAQVLEAGRQTAEIDRLGRRAVAALTLDDAAPDFWMQLVRGTTGANFPEDLRQYRTVEILALLRQRSRLAKIMTSVTDTEPPNRSA